MATESIKWSYEHLKEEQKMHVLNSMTVSDFCGFFAANLDDPICANALGLINKKRLRLLFQNLSSENCAKLLQHKTMINPAIALCSVDEKKRKEAVLYLDEQHRLEIIRSIQAQEERLIKVYKKPIVPRGIATGTFPKGYPQSGQACIVCNEGYEVFDSIHGADCTLHSFHKRHDQGGICPECPFPDVFPLGDTELLKEWSLEDIVISGFGYFYVDGNPYVLLSVFQEQREVYWFAMDSVARVFETDRFCHKLTRFFISELASAHKRLEI
ncbi:hypothetical protein CC78DRAFT_577234 [Lojkania enalia]|uniref:Uncharacterized protein n=1 Tax=Lojkania enalia TaxID=147567 RepID=A0A9P4KIS3_9PLEO|nr:hypothetical protein CC78DRAFT_577234 [Didymosphaeria enalia]